MLIYVEERKKIILMLRIIIYANAFLFFHPLFWISHRTGRSFSICNYYWILYMYVYVYTGNVYRNVLILHTDEKYIFKRCPLMFF